LPDDLAPELAGAGISGTIVVQAAPTLAETEFLLGLSERHDFIKGVVGWLDFDGADFAGDLKRLLDHGKLVGLRPMLQDLDDDGFVLRPRVIDNLKRLADTRLVFEYLIFPRHLAAVAESLRRVPGLKAVIDHLSKPPIRQGALEPWARQLTAVAAFPNAACKISGLFPEEQDAGWSLAAFAPFLAHALDVFGPGRLIWGSNWPVSLLATDYQTTHDAIAALLAPVLGLDELAAVFGGNAVRLYGLA
ncbi:MAG: amidohydrolase family protein, partial [Alphaproteobacteria bacterium]|nr:amidohydrolase family protein [Alphaproteobacteria bacterium]